MRPKIDHNDFGTNYNRPDTNYGRPGTDHSSSRSEANDSDTDHNSAGTRRWRTFRRKRGCLGSRLGNAGSRSQLQ